MLALLKHKLNEFCMYDGLENGRQQVGQEGYVNGGHCNEGQNKVILGRGRFGAESGDFGSIWVLYVECRNINDMKMQPFI